MEKETEKSGMSRRKFINSVALTGAAFSIVPRNVLGGKGYTAPSDKLNIAVIGVGGKGRSIVLLLKLKLTLVCHEVYQFCAMFFHLLCQL